MSLAIKGNRSQETLHHFNCVECGKWWTIADAPTEKQEWFCPWCGHEQRYDKF